jgi:hypothetical protein
VARVLRAAAMLGEQQQQWLVHSRVAVCWSLQQQCKAGLLRVRACSSSAQQQYVTCKQLLLEG